MNAGYLWNSHDASLKKAQHLDRICVTFESAWTAGQRPSLEAVLSSATDDNREELLQELLQIEIFHRVKAGNLNLVAEYTERFPQVDSVWLRDLIERLTAWHASNAGNQGSTSSLHGPTGTDTASYSAPVATRQNVSPVLSLPGYEILGELGRGGMGVVYHARHLELGRTVAIKMILTGGIALAGDVARLRREAAVIAQLSDPRIVQLFDIGVVDGKPYLVMEYVPGPTLLAMIQGSLPPPRVAARLVAELARSIHEAHLRKIIHRDLKPANILIDGGTTSENRNHHDWLGPLKVKITDFGLAKTTTESSSLSKSGAVLGTPSYMSPEQARGDSQIGPLTDVYSLGSILYELLTGRPPFKSFQVATTLWEVLQKDPLPPRQLQPQIPSDLNTICLKCLEKAPHGRYEDARSLADDLDRYLNNEPILARRISPAAFAVRWCQRHPAPAAAWLFGLVAAVSLALVAVIYPFAIAQARAATATRLEQRKTAEALDEVSRLKREAERLSASLAINQGHALCEGQNAARGLLWLAHGLTLIPDGLPDMSAATRKNIAAWREQVHTLKHVCELPRESMAMAMNASGDRVAVAGYDRFVRIFDTRTGELIGSPLKHKQSATAVAFSADGKQLASGEMDGSISLWSVESGQLERTWRSHSEQIYALLFTGTDQKLISASRDSLVQAWNPADGARAGQSWKHDAPVVGIAVTPNGQHLLTGSADGFVRRFDLASGEPIGQPLKHPSGVMSLAMSHDGQSYVVGRQDGSAQIFDTVSDLPRGRPLEHRAMIGSVAFSADDRWVLTASRDATARLWEAKTCRQIGSPLDHQDELCTAQITPDGSTIATTGDDRTLRLWQVAPLYGDSHRETDERTLANKSDAESLAWESRQYFGTRWRHLYMQTVGYSPSGRLAYKIVKPALEIGKARNFELYDTATGNQIEGVLTLDGVLQDIAFSPDESQFITVSKAGTATLWSVSESRFLTKQVLNTRRVSAAAFHPTHHTVVTAGRAGLEFWKCANGHKDGPMLSVDFPVQGVFFDRQGKRIGLTSADGQIRLLDAQTNQLLAEFSTDNASGISSASFSDGGQSLLVTNWDGLTCLWHLDAVPPKLLKLAHREPVWAAKFSPNGETVAVATSAGNVHFWNAASGIALATPFQQREFIDDLTFSADGKTVLLGTYEKKLRLIDAFTGWPLGPSRECQSPVQHVRFLDGDNFYRSGDQDLSIHVFTNPEPREGSPETIRSHLESLCGLRLGEDNVIRCLSAAEWNAAAHSASQNR